MQIFKVFAIVTAICSSSASACFQSGANWGDHNKARAELNAACDETIAGDFKAGEVKTKCRNGDGSKSYVFEVRNQNNYPAFVDDFVCFENIWQEIENCGHGGEHVQNGIKYRGDPNSGRC